jgi:hypothetical protein
MKVKSVIIQISVEDLDYEKAIKLLEEAIECLKGGTRHALIHPAEKEPYLPYTYISCTEHEVEADEGWEYDGSASGCMST